MANILDFQQTQDVKKYFTSRVAWILEHGFIHWNLIVIRYTSEYINVIHVLPVHGHHLNFGINSCQLL